MWRGCRTTRCRSEIWRVSEPLRFGEGSDGCRAFAIYIPTGLLESTIVTTITVMARGGGRGAIIRKALEFLRPPRRRARGGGRARPQGFTERQSSRFARGARRLRREAGLPDGDLVIHGSRVRGTARNDSDIDVALRVGDREFFDLAERCLERTHPGTRLRETMLHRINHNGQLSSFDLGTDFQRLRRQLLDSESPFPVQFSVLRRGGRLDTGPFTPLD
jgi:hypothetical protein